MKDEPKHFLQVLYHLIAHVYGLSLSLAYKIFFALLAILFFISEFNKTVPVKKAALTEWEKPHPRRSCDDGIRGINMC